jgi:serine/threonine protein kinase
MPGNTCIVIKDLNSDKPLYNLIIKAILEIECYTTGVVVLKTVGKFEKDMYFDDIFISKIKQIGKGSHGIILKITKTNASSYILKIGKVDNILPESIFIEKLEENGGSNYVIKSLNPPVIIENIMALALPYYDTDLRQLILSNQDLNDSHIKCILLNILLGLSHMHSLGIIHGDLKPSNILVQANPLKCIVADLGLSQNKDSLDLKPHICSRWYRPPEIILGQSYSLSADMWSFACILYELITGDILFKGGPCGNLSRPTKRFKTDYYEEGGMIDLISKDIKSNDSVKNIGIKIKEKNYDDSLFHLFQMCIIANKDERITAKDALKHPYFSVYVEYLKNKND